jgi:hypothetical protein
MLIPNWMIALGVTTVAFVAGVALMATTRALETREPDYLSQDEVVRLAATKFVGYGCGINIERTSKAEELERRAIGDTNEKAIARAAGNLKNADCHKLLVQFHDMMTRRGD